MTPEAKITAAALGELDEELPLDAEIRAEMAAIETIADALRDELSAEPEPKLTDGQREAIVAAASPPSLWRLMPYTLAAATSAAALSLAFLWVPGASRAEDTVVTAKATPAPEFHVDLAKADQGQEEQTEQTELPLEFLPKLEQRGKGRYWDNSDKVVNLVDPGEGSLGWRIAGEDTLEADQNQPESLGYLSVLDDSRSMLRNRRAQVDDISLSGISTLFSALDDSRSILEPSTFSIDVDTASYAIVRRHLMGGVLPPVDAVRIEELINYFPYADPPPAAGDPAPVAVRVNVGDCVWDADRRLVRIGIKGREVVAEARPPTNLVFLIDVSGSMQQRDKLPLLKRSLRQLVGQLRPEDQVAIVVYAGAAGQVLPSTAGDNKGRIEEALLRLEAGGSTNGGAGIELAYRVATRNFIDGGVNRVVLATDGDFNVGITNRDALIGLIQKKAKAGVELSIVGFGHGGSADGTMEELSNKGNGNYAFIDTDAEAHKVLVEQVGGTLQTIAKDVKVQVHFNPERIEDYRLVGYHNRMLATEDFDNDEKDAGEIGSGHTVTALYEVLPKKDAPTGDPALQVKIRYKPPGENESLLLEHPVDDLTSSPEPDARWAAAVAGFGTLLRGEEKPGTLTWDAVRRTAQGAQGADPEGYRREFLDLIGRAQGLMTGEAPPPMQGQPDAESPPEAPVLVDPIPEERGHGRHLFWLIMTIGFSLVAGPLAWAKGAAMRARYENLGLPHPPAPTATTLLGIATTIFALALAALALA